MKSGVSSLNPYAASYVPLSKREGADESQVFKLTPKDSKSVNETIWFEPPSLDTKQNQHRHKVSLPYDTAEVKFRHDHGFCSSSSQNRNEMAEKQMLDEEFDMDLAYLLMTFPRISDQSLTDVYVANNGDLDATVDMLSQLEDYTVGFSENLPDTLDIGDVSESRSSTERASMKLKDVVGEASSSPFGSSATAFAT